MNQQLAERYLAAKRALFEAYYGARLNPEQTRAVLTVNGPLLILAGAGSGKTTVLVNRICHIIKYGTAYESDDVPASVNEEEVRALEAARSLPREEIEGILPSFIQKPCPPWAMLAITFTNKAAREIKERLAATLSDESLSNEIWAGTFHSICVRILRKYGERIGLASGFSIYDTADKKRLVSETMKELNIDDKILPLKSVMSEISAAKDKLISPRDYPEGRDLRQRHIGRIYTAYQEHLEKNNAVDFDDIIMKTVILLEKNEDVLRYYQRKFEYVCVDEYQDTNPAQFRLTYLLSGGYRNIMVVGDDDQSIYKFRGATIENILNFDRSYPDAAVIKLEQNYRSTRTILDAANAVIAHNPERRAKQLWSAGEVGEPISIFRAAHGEEESRFIVDTILRHVVHDKMRYSDFAVLYRVNEISRGLETVFAKSGIPHRILGGMRFYDRKEIKDIIAYLYVILNPTDDQRLRRIINEPKRKIGDKTVETVAAIAEETGASMFAVMEYASAFPPLAKVADKLMAFAELIKSFQGGILKPSALLPQVMEKTGYLDMLRAGGEAMKTDIDNLNELVSAAVEYEAKNENATLAGFLEEAALVSDVDKYDEDTNTVVLMTIHSAKGLEFPYVFLAGAEEGIFPGMQSIGDPSELAEERRLAYVAITRAKHKLYISYAAERVMYGSTQYHKGSRFIEDEIPARLKTPVRPQRAEPKPSVSPSPRRSAPVSSEFSRRASIVADRPTMPPRATARFSVGDRVRHPMFGEGEILDVRPMGGDVLYEVKFGGDVVKKLMATYAKLERA